MNGHQKVVIVLGSDKPEVQIWRPQTGSYEKFSFREMTTVSHVTMRSICVQFQCQPAEMQHKPTTFTIVAKTGKSMAAL
jgi:hypothetical protein